MALFFKTRHRAATLKDTLTAIEGEQSQTKGSTTVAPPESPTQTQSNDNPYPWSIHHLYHPPAILKLKSSSASLNLIPTTPSLLPFPRYGHALPVTPNQAGGLYFFGGLAGKAPRNDLYLFSPKDNGATLLGTGGHVPGGRVGHAGAVRSSALIVWGGDTRVYGKEEVGGKEKDVKKKDGKKKKQENEALDDGLYLLNLDSLEWTRVRMYSPGPAGRYGHTATMVGSKLFVFGGQADREFFDDLWSFDLNSLRTKAVWEHYEFPGSPPPRADHACVSYKDQIIIFGGTNGQFHYNDTWSYDVTTNAWSELQCFGFIPVHREGHAMAVVDDILYVFGGRGADGKNLDDLAAFNLNNRIWYEFTNMGPAPSGRSGHAMAAVGSKLFVLGGQAVKMDKTEDHDVVHVLETKHIKYPDVEADTDTDANSTTGSDSDSNLPKAESQESRL